jgi:SAM-dependent methyltransferase
LTREADSKLDFTGERFTPECVREIWYEHVHRYVFARGLVEGKNVLDAACGEGYGAYTLAAKAGRVTGVDLSQAAITHAFRRYSAPNLSFQQADCCNLPFPDGHFDCIVSFETLEHLESQQQMLKEFRRVLAAEGFLVISSPDKAVYTDQLKNNNIFHRRELYRKELESLLLEEFPEIRLLGHKLAFHSMIWPLRSGPNGGSEAPGTAQRYALDQQQGEASFNLPGPTANPVYFIALCAAEKRFLPNLENSLWLFDDMVESVYQHYHHEIRKNMQAGKILESKEEEIIALKAALGLTKRPVRRSWWRRILEG